MRLNKETHMYSESIREKERELVNKILDKLETSPKKFTAIWRGNEQVEMSVRNTDGRLFIDISSITGQINSPTILYMSKLQLDRSIKLVSIIINRDNIEVINDAINQL